MNREARLRPETHKMEEDYLRKLRNKLGIKGDQGSKKPSKKSNLPPDAAGDGAEKEVIDVDEFFG